MAAPEAGARVSDLTGLKGGTNMEALAAFAGAHAIRTHDIPAIVHAVRTAETLRRRPRC